VTVELSAARFDAVVFDMDGVITDTARAHEAAWKRMFDEYLQDATFTHEDYLAYVDGRPRQDGVAGFLASLGITLPPGRKNDTPETETIWGLANRKNRDFLHVITTDGVRAFPSSVALVRTLQTHDIKTAIISASRNAGRILEAAGIGDLFLVRVDGVELERLGLPGKPAPDMFVEAAQRLGAPTARTVVVEDAIAGVEAGRRGNFGLVLGVDRTGTGDALRAHGADVVVRDLGVVAVRDA
jgi:alpha,alpha-trehalase